MEEKACINQTRMGREWLAESGTRSLFDNV